jgi:sialic acid synthase SpsE
LAAEPYIVAEIASAHEGDPEFARRLFRLAAGTGADAIKFQIFRRDSLLSRRHPKFDSFGQIEIAPERWREILAEAGASSADVWVEVFDEASLALAESSGAVAGYKIPTSDIGNLPFLVQVAATGRPVHLGVGGATEGEIGRAVAALEAQGCAPVLMLGFQSYPTSIADTHLARLGVLARVYGLPVGYADHVDAEDRALAFAVPAMALAAGANVIEKHITDDRARKGRDHYSALEPAEFAEFVAFLRRVATGLGRPEIALSPAEVTYRHQMKRQAVAARPLAAGSGLTPEDVVFKRTDRDGLSPTDMAALWGRALKSAKGADDPLLREDVE